MTRDEYIKSILKQLNCDKKEKQRIASDLTNDINIALQHGESMEEIIDRMGKPEEIAEGLMENIGIADPDSGRTYNRKIFYVIGACCVFLAGFLMNFILQAIVQMKPAESAFQESFYYMICWLVLLILLIVVEILTMGLTTIWFAGGSLIALIIAVAGLSPLVQVICFCIISAVLLFVTRPIAMRYFNKNREKTNIDSLVGRSAVVTVPIDNAAGTGEAVIDGMIWTARSISDTQTFAKGERVQIVRISGVKLMVKR